MLWDPERGQFVIFGGNGGHEYNNDIWAYNAATTNWEEIDPYVMCPGNVGFTKPNGTDDSNFKYDPVNKLYWVFGVTSGYRCVTFAAIRTAGAGSTFTSLVDPNLSSDVTDAYVNWHVIVGSTDVAVTGYNAATKTLSLASPINGLTIGTSYKLYASHTSGFWYFDPVTKQWTGQIPPGGSSGITPGSRTAPAVAYSDADKAFVLFGGARAGVDRQVWRLDVQTKLWTQLPQPALTPPNYREMLNSFVYDRANNVFILFGGICDDTPRCAQNSLGGQTWVYSLATNTWTHMNPVLSPSPRAQQGMAYDDDNGVVTLFGGATQAGVSDETWYYHYPSNTWTQVMPATKPKARYLSQIAYDPVAKRTLVYSGSGAGVGADIWSLRLTPSAGAPVVALTAPASGSTYTAPASIGVAANATDSDGNIVKVEFFAGSTKIGEAASAPYALDWHNVAAGTYLITARATDDQGVTVLSSTVSVTVNPAPPQPPTISMTAPANGSTYTAPASIALNATAADPDGSISKVEYFLGTTKLGQATSAPYAFSWNNVVAGTYTLTAVATDNSGMATTSAPVSVTVDSAPPPPNQAPSVSLSAPNGSSYTAPASIALSVSAADADGSVAKVEFFLGATKLATVTSAPYTFTWSNVAAGTYSLTAVATDNQGASTSSAPVAVIVTDPSVPAGAINVALQSNGGVASVSSLYSTNFTAGGINNGDRRSSNWSQAGTGWMDGTSGAFPDWAQVTFAGVQSISQVKVYTLADSFATAPEPTASTTFTQYGITAFQVQYWSGTQWLTVPGGSITGNNLAIRSISFAPISTDRIRVLVSHALYWNTRIIELEAWGTPSAPGNAAPSVALSSPASGSSFTVPASLTLTASASDSDGNVTSVDFYAGATKIGTATSAPYSISWSGMAVGTYSLTAVATDNSGATTTSAAVSVIVSDPANPPPTVSLSSPASGSSFTTPASITLSANAADTNGSITKVDFYAGATKVGTATSAPYSVTWNTAVTGSYSITAVATDNQGASTTSAAATITIAAPPNQAPSVSLSAPNGSGYTAPASIALSVSAADADGSVAKVEFFLGATKLATVTSAPYTFTWSNVAAGTYSLTAVATDNQGASTSSAPVAVIVTDPSVPAGAINVALQSNGGVASVSSLYSTNFTAGGINNGDRRSSNWSQAGTGWMDGTSGAFPDWAQVTFAGVQSISQVKVYTLADSFATAPEPTASTTFTQYGITAFQVQYWSGTQWLTVPGGSITGNNLAIRSISFAPISTDRIRVLVSHALYWNTRIIELEAWGTPSAPGNAAPSVALSSPASGSSFTVPASLTLTASASDSDGNVTSVDFYAGATKIGTATSAPYSISWSGMAVGTYSLTAVATDNSGATTTSAAVSVIVSDPANPPPTVSLSSPASGSSFTTPASITLSANAADTNGSITKVDFYAGATKVGTATSAPYSVTWNTAVTGSYSITAVATDNQGASTTSAAATITIAAPPNQAPSVSLSAPNGSGYTAPASIALSVSAADADGSVAKVEFFLGATKLATVTSAPYTFTWSNVAAGTYSLTAVATDNQGASTSSAPVAVIVTDPSVPAGAINVALQSNGGVASVSSLYSTNFTAGGINNGDRRSSNWSQAGTGWMDGTSGAFPDWAQVTFAGVQSISQVKVYTLADSFATAPEPTASTTFTQYGITAFQVQYWSGTQWLTVPGGSITGNNLAIRSISFAPISTDRIRVLVSHALYWNTRIIELEAWGTSP